MRRSPKSCGWDAAQPEELRMAGLLAWRDERSENGPFLVAQVGRVGMSVYPNHISTKLCFQAQPVRKIIARQALILPWLSLLSHKTIVL